MQPSFPWDHQTRPKAEETLPRGSRFGVQNGGTRKPSSGKDYLRSPADLLTFQSTWNPPLGQPLMDALASGDPTGRLDIGCVAAHGMFGCDDKACYSIAPHGKPATAFLFELVARLQSSATVPMIDIRTYANWLTK